MIKQILTGAFTALMLFIARPTDSMAADTGDNVKIDDSGYVTLVSDHADKDDITTLRLSLNIEASPDADVSFRFSDDNKAKISEYRYNAESNQLNIYISGTESLFNDTDTLDIGAVEVSDKSGNAAAFKVSTSEDSLEYVYNNKLVNDNIVPETAEVTAETTTTTTTTITTTTTTTTTVTTSSTKTSTTTTTTKPITTTTSTSTSTTTITTTTTSSATPAITTTTTSTSSTDLPQTGNNSTTKIISVISAVMLIGLGCLTVKISGIRRRRKHEK